MTQDDLDESSISQLHDAVIEFSKSCFELKKLCATVLGVALALIATFTRQQLDPALFVGCAIIVGFFWMADAQSYYYQDKLRGRMKALQEDIIDRNGLSVSGGVGMPLSSARQKSGSVRRAIRSFFNFSMSFYYGLFAIDGVISTLYATGLLEAIK